MLREYQKSLESDIYRQWTSLSSYSYVESIQH